jgi:cell division transport system permease protein
MKSFIYNVGYFVREAGRVIRRNLLSNLFSLLGTGLILFLLGMVLTGGTIGNRLMTMLSEEAEINAYFTPGIAEDRAELLVEQISKVEGVLEARYVTETEAEDDMRKVLGDEAKILDLFEENPFEAFVEVRIQLDSMDTVSERIDGLDGIDYIRNNREVLEQLRGITRALSLLGLLVLLAVGITTVIILSHMIRQGIYNNKEQINTLRLLGAPNAFIGFPYVLVGILLTLGGGILATVLLVFLIHGAYGQLGGTIPFLPLPPKQELVTRMAVLIPAISLGFGFLGSLFGLSSIRDNDSNR